MNNMAKQLKRNRLSYEDLINQVPRWSILSSKYEIIEPECIFKIEDIDFHIPDNKSLKRTRRSNELKDNLNSIDLTLDKEIFKTS